MQFACNPKPYNVQVANQEFNYQQTERYQGQPSQMKMVKSASRHINL